MSTFFVAAHAGLLLLFFSGNLLGQTDQRPVVRVTTKASQSKASQTFVGELIADTEKAIELHDINSNQTVVFPKADIVRVENPLSLDDAARYSGIAPFVAHRIDAMTRVAPLAGKVAKVSPQVLYVTLGKQSGVQKGQKLQVYRREGDIIDPDTGEVLASERPRIGEVEITEVGDRISKARLTGDFEVKLEIGDEVQATSLPFVIAISPLSNEDGSTNPDGASLAEELTSALVQRNVSVVERSVLDKVVTELVAQNTLVFDEKGAQKLGKLTGANMVVAGKILPEGASSRAHVRLIDVETGKVLLAISTQIKPSKRSSASTSSARPSLKTTSVDFIKGAWSRSGSRMLYSDAAKDGLARIAVELPEGFQISMKCTPSSLRPNDCLAFYFKFSGRDYIAQLCNTGTCLIISDEPDPRTTGAAYIGDVFRARRTSLVTVSVEKGSIRIEIDKNEVIFAQDNRINGTQDGFTLGILGNWTLEDLTIGAK